MPRLLSFGLTAAAFLMFSAGAQADADSDPLMFGGEVPVEENLYEPAENVSPEEQTPPAAEADSPASEAAPVVDYPAETAADISPVSNLPQAGNVPAATTEATGSGMSGQTSAADSGVGGAQTLTGALQQDNSAAASEDGSTDETTWIDKLSSSNPLDLLDKDKKSDSALRQMVAGARDGDTSRRSNASVFDISGIMLRMSLKQADTAMQNRGFRKILQRYQIPNFIKWRNEEACRNSGVVGYERLEACVTDKAKKDGHEYVQVAKYVKLDTKEDVEITLSSNFTENKVIKIVYKSQAANITGNSPKANYIRNIKVYDFWKKVNQKYGRPDDKTNVIWGLGGNKPFLKADTGKLILEDPMLRELDYTRMSREDQRYMNTDLYSF